MSQTSNNQRISSATSKALLDYPDFLEVQLKSFRDFFQLDTTADSRRDEGLFKVFQEIFLIEDTRNNFTLEFIDYFVDPSRYSIEECLEMGLTYKVPLKAKLKLSCNDKEHEDLRPSFRIVYLGDIPYMTPRGTFVINGSERIVVSSYIVHQVYSSDRASTPMEPNSILPVLFPSRDHGSSLQQTSIM